MSVAEETTRLDLDALTDEVIRLHRLTSGMQPVAAAVQDFARRVGRDRMILAYNELIAEKIRQRVEERGREALRTPPQRPRQPRSGVIPVRVSPVAEEPPAAAADTPEPESREEFAPGSVLWHTTQTGDCDGGEPEPAWAAARVQPVAPDVLAGILRDPETTSPPPAVTTRPVAAVVPRPAVVQPSRRLASMRSTSPEETWKALGDVLDVGTTGSKKRGDLSPADEMIIIALARSDEERHAKLTTEAHQARIRAERELEAMRRCGAEKVSDLPEHVLNSLYGRRPA